MSIIAPHPVSPRADVRALLVAQQQRTHGAVAIPRMLQAPVIVALWCAILVLLVSSLALARVRVPRVAPATVLALPPTESAPAVASQGTILLLPSGVAPFVKPGQLAAVDTGGSHPVLLSVASVDPRPVGLAEARRRYTGLPGLVAAFRTPRVVARLEPCRDGACVPLPPGVAFHAVARLGTRSLASYAIPGI